MNQSDRLNPFSDLLERHVDDLSFLWVLRSVSVYQPQYTLVELKKLENRMDKHVDALMLSPDTAWECCQKAGEFEEGGEAFSMAMMAFRQLDVNKIQAATDFGLLNTQTIKGITSALGWLPDNYSMPWVSRFIKSKNLDHKYLAVMVYSVKRLDPGDVLQSILSREDCLNHIALYARSLRLIGELKRLDLMPVLAKAMGHKNPQIKFWANWSAILMGDKDVLPNIKQNIIYGPFQVQAIDLAFKVLPPQEARIWISELSKSAKTPRLVIRAVATLGDTQAVPWLIEKMKDPELARVAGEAFSLITGINLEQAQLSNTIADLSKDIDDEDNTNEFSMDDDNLPWPNSEKVAACWETYGNRLPSGVRYFLGKKIEVGFLRSVLVTGGQRARHAAALELALLVPQEIYINVNATASRESSNEPA